MGVSPRKRNKCPGGAHLLPEHGHLALVISSIGEIDDLLEL